MTTYVQTYDAVAASLFTAGSFTPYYIGPIEQDLRNDSEQQFLRDTSDDGRISFYGCQIVFRDEDRICKATRREWELVFSVWYEAKSNENQTRTVGARMDSLIAYIDSNLYPTFGGIFEYFNPSETGPQISIQEIGNSRVYQGAFSIIGISEQ